MSDIKVGDTVRYTSDRSSILLKQDKDYKVKAIRPFSGMLIIEGDYENGETPSSGIAIDRFVKVEPSASKAKRDYVADHARRTLRAAGLTKDEARNVVAAMLLPGNNWPVGSRWAAMRDETTRTVVVSRFSRSIPGNIPVTQVVGDTFSWDAAEKALNLESGYFIALHDRCILKENTSA